MTPPTLTPEQAIQVLHQATRRALLSADDHELCAHAARTLAHVVGEWQLREQELQPADPPPPPAGPGTV